MLFEHDPKDNIAQHMDRRRRVYVLLAEDRHEAMGAILTFLDERWWRLVSAIDEKSTLIMPEQWPVCGSGMFSRLYKDGEEIEDGG